MNKHLPLVPEHAQGDDRQATNCGTTNQRIYGSPIGSTGVYMGGCQDLRWTDNGQDGWTEALSVRIDTVGGKTGTEHVIRDPFVAETLAAQLLDGAIKLRKALERGRESGEEVLNGAGA